MTLASRYAAWKYKLPPAETYAITHHQELPIPMPDGAVLLADHYFPTQGGKLPTILMRSPYGRRGSLFGSFSRLLAERGFQVLVQSCRGTFGSGGEFFPFRNERADGLATIAWLKQQSWYSGEYALLGPSYLSFVQWAVAASVADENTAVDNHSSTHVDAFANGFLPADLVFDRAAFIQRESVASASAAAGAGAEADKSTSAAASAYPSRTTISYSTDPDLKALIPIITGAEFRSLLYPGETFSLESMLSWAQSMVFQEDPPWKSFFSKSRRSKQLAKAYMHLPLNETDSLVTGHTLDYFQEWLEHNSPEDDWWESMDHRPIVAQVKAPVHLIGGFYDVLLPQTLECYHILRENGQNPYLTIGPWSHDTAVSQPVTMNETFYWLQTHLGNRSGSTRNGSGSTRNGSDGTPNGLSSSWGRLRTDPVRLYVMGSGEWMDFESWPPDGYTQERWYLREGGWLGKSLVTGSKPDRYHYDPTDPTPALGGSSLTINSGPRDNRKLEARSDVLTYTSQPLKGDLEVIGPVRVELYVRSSLQHTDFFARLCDVYPSGKSINLSDGIVRLEPGRPVPADDGVLRIDIELWPTANCFKTGHRIRLQVSSGAHPRFARNPGSGEPLATAIHLIPADQEVFHDVEHPSAILLPVREFSTRPKKALP